MKQSVSAVLCVVALGASFAGCRADDEAVVTTPSQPIAVGAYFPLSVGDACSGDPKLPVCSTEAVVSIDEVRNSNPRIVQVSRMQEISEGMRVDGAQLVLFGTSPGETELAFDTTFDDGSQRSVETNVSVAHVDGLDLQYSCSVASPDDRRLFPTQAQLDLQLDLYHGDTKLLGEHLNPLTGAGLSRLEGELRANRYRWTSPGDVGSLRLASPILADFSATLRTYLPSQQTLVSLTPITDLAQTLRYRSSVGLEAKIHVAGKTPCRLYPLQLTSLTPETCSGLEDETTWSAQPEFQLWVKALATGSCRLEAKVTEASPAYSLEFDLNVGPSSSDELACHEAGCPTVPDPDPVIDPCQNVVCDPMLAACPQGQELTNKDGCCNHCSPVLDAALCETERAGWDKLYDANFAGRNACIFDADCVGVDLLGGCRRYCNLLLNGTQVALFMTAVSEAFYTSCPHCAVESLANCGPRPAVYCDSGQCKVAP